jgi:hypothetical protein
MTETLPKWITAPLSEYANAVPGIAGWHQRNSADQSAVNNLGRCEQRRPRPGWSRSKDDVLTK